MINHQSDQLKTRKFYKYFSENADFSKLSGKGRKTKGQILKHSNDSLWTKPSEILAFTAMFRIYCIPRTLSSILYTYVRLLCVIQKVQFLLESQMMMILGIAIEAVIATMLIKSPIIYFP